MRLKKVLVFLISLTGYYAQAQLKPLSLNEAIATSLMNNYEIRISRNDSLLAALNNSYADYALLPRLSANSAYIRNNNNQKQVLADGTERKRSGIQSSNISASVNLDWTLFDGFRMFITRRRLNEMVELGELQIKNQVVTTVADVMQLYFDLVRQQQQLRNIEEQMALNEERLKLAQYKFEIGTGVKPDMLQAQIDLNAQRSAHLAQQTNIAKSKGQLNNLMAVPVGQDFIITDTTITFNTTLTIDSIQSSVTTTNPQLLILQKNRDIATLTMQERRAERFPVVEFNSAYNFNRNNNNSVINPFQPLFNQNRGLNYGLRATIPIFNGYNTRRQIRAAELDIEYQGLLYERNLAQITTSVANAYRDYDLFKRTLALEEENIKLVRENLFIARERYRLGITTFIEMREAQRSLEDANYRLIQARFNTKVAEIELLRLRGDIIR